MKVSGQEVSVVKVKDLFRERVVEARLRLHPDDDLFLAVNTHLEAVEKELSTTRGDLGITSASLQAIRDRLSGAEKALEDRDQKIATMKSILTLEGLQPVIQRALDLYEDSDRKDGVGKTRAEFIAHSILVFTATEVPHGRS